MGFIPKDARWYLADVILEHIVEDDPRNLVHVNTHLVEADSPEQAHSKALALGSGAEQEYSNTDGKQVRVVFRGLRELNVIHEALEDGGELAYTETMGVPEEQLRGWITPKEQLGVFAPFESKSGPNYMPGSVMQMLEAEGFSRDAARTEVFMSDLLSANQKQLLAELESLPEEYYPFLLQMIRNYRESVLLQPAADSFRRGWKEAQAGETLPVDRLWEGLDVE